MSAGLRAEVGVWRGSFHLDVALQVQPGEILAVLGPNGAGKSTLLRVVAGLLAVAEGSVACGGSVWDDPDGRVFVPAPERRAGYVFQDYRLFPHLSVLDNVAFGARSRGMSRRASRGGAAAVLERLDLTELASRRPAQLSGGQAQRVALARALASDPEVLLLDEPLAALDARTRIEVRGLLRRHLADFGGPTLLVVHDPLEAMVLADRILVIENGHVVQTGTPSAVARHPATEYVARLVGVNLYAGTVVDPATGRIRLDDGGELVAVAGAHDVDPDDPPGRLRRGERVQVALRPASITLHTREPDGSARNRWRGRVVGMEQLADRVRVEVSGPFDAAVDITASALAELAIHEGVEVWLSAKATEVVAYPGGEAPIVDPEPGE
ncbi:MAG: ABC transporter ATP-binding protein [Actinobacteria bacterium]|nr:ABC transporter ATP-binding protein [Actinomycetota bacterium]MCG2802147.1 ABC transporter ATP-binding protein [Cellulomonas sp.]